MKGPKIPHLLPEEDRLSGGADATQRCMKHGCIQQKYWLEGQRNQWQTARIYVGERQGGKAAT